MKRMSEVFELPLSTTFNFDHEWTAEDESEGIRLSGFNPIASSDKVVLLAAASSEVYCNIDYAIDNISDCAVRAINHVDALADALVACVAILGEMEATENVSDAERAYYQAVDALAAYRGDK